MADHKFFACPACGATIRDDRVSLHDEWHNELVELVSEPVASTLELEEWPKAALPVSGEPAGL